MSKRTIYKVHKWFALTVALFFLAWLMSGILMAVPQSWLKALVQTGSAKGSAQAEEIASRPAIPPQADFRDIRISVPQAISALEVKIGREVQVTGIKLARLGTRLAYEITLEDDSRHLVDAGNGAHITVSQAMAEKIASAAAPNAGEIISTALLSRRDYHYWGPLPVYKIVFNDSPGTVVYVSAATGKIEVATSRLSRLHHWVTSFHTFEPLRLISENDSVRVALLLLFAVVGIATVCTGLYIAFPMKSRSSQGARQAVVERDDKKFPGPHGSTVR